MSTIFKDINNLPFDDNEKVDLLDFFTNKDTTKVEEVLATIGFLLAETQVFNGGLGELSHLDGEHSSFSRLSGHIQSLTECKQNCKDTLLKVNKDFKKMTKHTESNKSSNNLTTIPSKLVTAKCEGENERNNHASEESSANPVDLFDSLPVWFSFLSVKIWNQENKGRSNEGSNWKINVKCPSPTSATVGKCTADNGAEDGAQSPHSTCQSDIGRS